MTLTQEIKQHADEIAGDLKWAGMEATPYKRAPIALEVASLSVEKGRQLRLWPGLADFVVHADRDHRQAVLNVDEKEREITRTYDFWCRDYWYSDAFDNPFMSKADIERHVRDDARRQFPVFVPKMKFETLSWSRLPNRGTWVRATATVSAPRTRQTFLVGIDETSHFISPLKHRVNDVEAAHALLRPRHVPEGTLRQGEWFFVPATVSEIREISRSMKSNSHRFAVRQLEPYSTHEAPCINVNAKLFACGAVTDRRRDRHAPLLLNGWHRVHRNTEIVNPVSQQMRRTFNYD